MKARGSGSIINLSSTTGIMGFPLRSPYAVAKWGVVGLTKSLAMEVSSHGIRVNAIRLGPVLGDRMERVLAQETGERCKPAEEIKANTLARPPLGNGSTRRKSPTWRSFLHPRNPVTSATSSSASTAIQKRLGCNGLRRVPSRTQWTR